MLLRLVYVSTLADGVGRPEVDRIVEHSQAANGGRDVTGMLALDENRVCQILEGPEEAVDALYERIRHDPRHEGVVTLDRRPIAVRHFGRWGMTRRRMVDVVTLAFTT
jgi:hypothetical protein